MASPGTSDTSSVMNEKKRKRMISNRESAQRSRMRKEKLLNDLMSEVKNLKNQNSQLLTAFTLTTQNYYCVEAENNVLRTQMAELTNRLHSLNEMNIYLHANHMNFGCEMNMDSFINPYSCMNHPIMASADTVFQY